jgi:hypothetical protein
LTILPTTPAWKRATGGFDSRAGTPLASQGSGGRHDVLTPAAADEYTDIINRSERRQTLFADLSSLKDHTAQWTVTGCDSGELPEYQPVVSWLTTV